MDELTIIKKIEDFFCKPEGKFLLDLLTIKKYELLDELSEAKLEDVYQLQGQIKGIHEITTYIKDISVEINNRIEKNIDIY